MLQSRNNQKCENEIFTPLCRDDNYLNDAQLGKQILSPYRYKYAGSIDTIRLSPSGIPGHRRSVRHNYDPGSL